MQGQYHCVFPGEKCKAGKKQSHEELASFKPWALYIQQEFGVKNSDACVNTYLG